MNNGDLVPDTVTIGMLKSEVESNINANGLYTCTITDSKGCTSSNSINVNNIPTNISETFSEKKLVKIVDVLGRKNNKNTQTKIHIYSDGSVEKKYILK